jgi:hypothetical protein
VKRDTIVVTAVTLENLVSAAAEDSPASARGVLPMAAQAAAVAAATMAGVAVAAATAEAAAEAARPAVVVAADRRTSSPAL